ncbi:hypothetical protein TNCV_2266131 [Trichonephila clavipes]|nr:hypothetical protein TNCV_2266131 [Trichonephila clavipes]
MRSTIPQGQKPRQLESSELLFTQEIAGSVEHSLKTTGIEHAWDALRRGIVTRNTPSRIIQDLKTELLNKWD